MYRFHDRIGRNGTVGTGVLTGLNWTAKELRSTGPFCGRYCDPKKSGERENQIKWSEMVENKFYKKIVAMTL